MLSLFFESCVGFFAIQNLFVGSGVERSLEVFIVREEKKESKCTDM